MACVALTSLMATLELEFLQSSSPRVSLHDEATVKSLFEKLSSLQAFLQEKPKSGGIAIRDLEIKIRDFALDAEDRIEIQLSNFLLAKDKEDQEKASQQLHQTFGEAAENAAKLLKISNIISKEAADNNETQPPLIPRLKHASSPVLEGRMVVGLSYDHMDIVDRLIRGFYELTVIPIVGMNGIGKTTLAISVYNDPKVTSYFDVRGWVTMSGEYNNSQMLHDLLCTLAEGDENEKGSIPDDDVAAGQVYNFLRGKRYLIVLDNLWSNQAWQDIRQCFPNDVNGSGIVITTTHFRQDFVDNSHSYIHYMRFLFSDESWELFCNNLSLEQHMAPKFEKIRSQVVEKCEGLPHSIVVVARRLSKCDNIKQEWKKVEKEVELLGVLDRRALTLTYNQLPQHLKVCFLYFGVFPKHSDIKVKVLIRLWIVEGFIKSLEGKELENQAYEYLQDFIDRSLIIIVRKSSDRKIKTCRMHGALHSFCLREAQKESIFCAVNTGQYAPRSLKMFANSCRWLSLYRHRFDYYVLLRTNNPRSIFFFHEDAEISVSFKLLRVLTFVPSSFLQRVPTTNLHDLVFLRYLSVSEWFDGLDYVVSNNPNLQTLVVSGSNEFQPRRPAVHLPSTIWELPQLQHLELHNAYAIDPPIAVKDNMQTLSWVCPTHCRMEVYRRFPNIKKLKMFVFCSKPIMLDNLDYLECLERLTISVSFGCVVSLPKPSMFPSQLKKLRLNGTNLSEKDLMVIGMLPQLEVLKLKNAFQGEIWEVAKGGFHRLKFLLLEDKKLKQWIAEEDSFMFQCLERLVLKFCYCLKEIPQIMEDIPSLELIELEQCGSSVEASAKHIHQFRHELGQENFMLCLGYC
ncbi:PREDICTED: putative late blight resistance protein homolog R1A-4 [Ipomoea nil]|uniref:putative late blight resistance protein homolog R1A-4 n=1 Tax=Ipomoea nil TaxID=35883 RepID=UPI0009008A86|nr:PREDICTED: putative late blight resistance protein homolog R1A-4 [Ipomoea nil]